MTRRLGNGLYRVEFEWSRKSAMIKRGSSSHWTAWIRDSVGDIIDDLGMFATKREAEIAAGSYLRKFA